jgi:NO-binding membrane sensor protein with MHYT domain
MIEDSVIDRRVDAAAMAASFLMAFFGSFTALQIIKQRTGSKGKMNRLLLAAASLSLAQIGIWCMHFLAIIGLRLTAIDSNGDAVELSISLEPGLTALSFLLAYIGVFIGFSIVGDADKLNYKRLILAGLVTGCSVIGMHYCGHMSMSMPVHTHWSAGLVAASILIGLVAATAAFWIFFYFQNAWKANKLVLLAVAGIMMCAVCGLHYTANQAATYTFNSNYNPPSNYLKARDLLYVIIGFGSSACVSLLCMTIYLHKKAAAEIQKLNNLILSILIIDNDKRILVSNLTLALPSVVLESVYIGRGLLSDPNNKDFLLMFRTSLAWNSADKQLQELQQRSKRASTIPSNITMSAASEVERSAAAPRKVSASEPEPTNVSYSVQLYAKFIESAKKLASSLGLQLQDLGIMYLYPTQSMLTLILRTDSPEFYASAGNFRWAPADLFCQSSAYKNYFENLENSALSHHYCAQNNPDYMKHPAKYWLNSLLQFYNCATALRSVSSAVSSPAVTPVAQQQLNEIIIAPSAPDTAPKHREIYLAMLFTRVSALGVEVMVPFDLFTAIPMVQIKLPALEDGKNSSDLTVAEKNWLTSIAEHSTQQELPLKLYIQQLLATENLPQPIVSFATACLEAAKQLGELLGTEIDLTLANFFSTAAVRIDSSILLTFIASSMNPAFPAHYSRQNFRFLPLHLFESLQAAAHPSCKPKKWMTALMRSRLADGAKDITSNHTGGTSLIFADKNSAILGSTINLSTFGKNSPILFAGGAKSAAVDPIHHNLYCAPTDTPVSHSSPQVFSSPLLSPIRRITSSRVPRKASLELSGPPAEANHFAATLESGQLPKDVNSIGVPDSDSEDNDGNPEN